MLPQPNLPLLRKVLEHIDAHPEEWDQASWGKKNSCGTAFCVAGHAVSMSGVELAWQYDYADYCFDPETNGIRLISEAASELLGLTCEESILLFRSQNNRHDIQHCAERIAERAGEKL